MTNKDKEIKKALTHFKLHSYALRNGKGLISKRLKVSQEAVEIARNLIKKSIEDTTKVSAPKILILDIETAPMKAYVWKRWKEDISLDQTISEWFCLAWAAKWLYNPSGEYSHDIISEVLTPSQVKDENDYFIMCKLRELLNQADIVVAHNGAKFDIPRINSRFISLGINPPTPYYIVDTLREARKVFDFSSNKLDALASFMNTGTKKIKTDFSLWKSCMEGDEEALELMRDYNERDVYVLEKVYLKMRPFIKGHPNVGAILAKDNVCPICGSPLVTKYPGYYSTSVNRYTLYKCDRCHSVVRSRKPEEKSKVTHTSLGH